MKIVHSQEMRRTDEAAVNEVGMPNLLLMETAGIAAAQVVSRYARELEHEGEILLFCGKGKNGGDGLVTARHLLTQGYRLRIFLLGEKAQFQSESRTNLEILEKLKARITTVDSIATVEEYFKSAAAPYLVVDAILGTGLDRDVEGLYYEVIQVINDKATDVIALDIPSGVMGDTGAIAGVSIQATATVSFGYPKVGHFLPPGAARRGKFFNVDLGYPRAWGRSGDKFLLTPGSVAPLVQGRDPFGHKNSFGHCLLIGGSPGRLGAIVMSASSCLKMGTGLVTVASWEDSFPALEMKLQPEVMTYRVPRDPALFREIVDTGFLGGFTSVVVGPGLGTTAAGAELMKALLTHYRGPLVIDADGLNLISEHKLHDRLSRREGPCVLTPHPGEMARLLGGDKDKVVRDPLGAVREACELTAATVVLKGATTLVHSAEGITYFNHHPNDGMAKAGSGDVLAGMIGGLMGQIRNNGALAPARLGVYAHSVAGRLAAEDCGERSMTAVDIVAHINGAMKELSQYKTSRINDACVELF